MDKIDMDEFDDMEEDVEEEDEEEDLDEEEDIEEDVEEEELDEDEEEVEEEELEELDVEELDVEELDVEDLDDMELKDDKMDDDDYVDSCNFIEMNEEKGNNSKKRRRVLIQRYCKSLKELTPRKPFKKIEITDSIIKDVLSNYTTDKNATKFSTYCTLHKNELYQLCGKFMKKDFAYSDLFNELKSGITGWESHTFKEEKEAEDQDIAIMTIKLEVTEGLYQCSRCKSKKTYSRQVQTRSADEGMTSIIQCSECNKVWREYA